jgi:peptidoglycan/xylan/chitin deacetylase (PgdA/CDA1 family)
MTYTRQRAIPILMYHSISPQAHRDFRPFIVTPEAFAAQMHYIHKHDYRVFNVTQYITQIKQNKDQLPERLVVITFDDGFEDFYVHALPILQRHSYSATLYLATNYIGGSSKWLWREHEAERPILNWQQIREIQRSGIECGAHSHTHAQLDLLPLEQTKQEIIDSKKLLEEQLQQTVHSFAYPHGYHTAAIKRMVREAGFSSACAVKYETSTKGEDHFALSRLLVGPDITIGEFAALLTKAPAALTTRMYKSACMPLGRLMRSYTAAGSRVR